MEVAGHVVHMCNLLCCKGPRDSIVVGICTCYVTGLEAVDEVHSLCKLWKLITHSGSKTIPVTLITRWFWLCGNTAVSLHYIPHNPAAQIILIHNLVLHIT